MHFKSLSQKIGDRLRIIPSMWNSQSAVLTLSRECYPMWQQSEWLDFYFSYLCEKHLPHVIPMDEKVCGTTFFNGIQDFSPDFKAKTSKTSKTSRESSKELHNYQHWRQMEWIETYFNYLCEKKLSGLLQIPGPGYHQMSFSALFEIPWIFKVYIENIGTQRIILADADLITHGLSDFQQIGIIIATGVVEYYGRDIPEKEDKIKIRNKKQVMKKELRQHSIFRLKHIYFIPFSFDSVQKCETFQPGGVRTTEKLREKILLNIPDIQSKYQFSLNFSGIGLEY